MVDAKTDIFNREEESLKLLYTLREQAKKSLFSLELPLLTNIYNVVIIIPQLKKRVMIQKIISNLGLAGDIVLAAQSLVNEQFRLNVNALGIKEKTVINHLKHKLENFEKKVQVSTLLSQQEKSMFAELTSAEVYELARGIILELTRREIKTPK